MADVDRFIPFRGLTYIGIDRPKKLHLLGIGGSGMKAIAVFLNEMGHSVSGSDTKRSDATDLLEKLGIKIFYSHNKNNVVGKDAVIFSTAITLDNPEIIAAEENNIALAHRSAVLKEVSELNNAISVAGTHGKTTISWMITYLLIQAQFNPSYIIGGELMGTKAFACYNKDSPYLVLEADESDGSFLLLKSKLAVVGALEPDHLTHWNDFENLKQGFKNFLKNSESRVIFEDVKEVLNINDSLAVGFASGASFQISDVVIKQTGASYQLKKNNKSFSVRLKQPSMIAIKNSAVALASLDSIGFDIDQAAEMIETFPGVARRFEIKGAVNGITFIDDYAHLPTEVKMTIQATRALNPARLICVFQPHRYSRTKDLYQSFFNSFSGCDIVIITDIYPANEKPIQGITGEILYNTVKDAPDVGECYYIASKSELKKFLMSILKPNDLVLTMSAGDLTVLPTEMIESLTKSDK